MLEATQVPSNWHLGMLHNDFARRLDALEDEIEKVQNLWVLSGAGVDQRCWASEGLGRTVFSHFLIEGLRGKAATDGQLTLDKLHRYVRESVKEWVWNVRGAIQEPVLLPGRGSQSRAVESAGGKRQARVNKPLGRKSPSEVFLASAGHALAPEAPGPPDLNPVAELWKRFHQLNALVPHPTVYSPRRWRHYRAELVRYEELVRAGAASKTELVRERIDALAQGLERDRILRDLTKSAENTLAMSAVTRGRRSTLRHFRRAQAFLQFWNATRRSDAIKIWDGLRASASDPDSGPSLRLRIDEFLLGRAIAEPVNNLKTAAERLLVSSEGKQLAPAGGGAFLDNARALAGGLGRSAPSR